MVQSELDVLASARAIFDQKQYQKLRNFIWSNHGLCQTDPVKVQLLHLWEDSLYQEFIDARSPQHAAANGGSPPDVKAILSSSMRYKLRKKHPCPIELEQELRVKNARLPKPVHDGLNDWLKKHTENPYPNKVEKEALATKLGITPQQVNRWFIQRRKMLRIRGHLYLGRQYETQKGKDKHMDHMLDDHDDDDDDEELMIDENDDNLSRHSDDSASTTTAVASAAAYPTLLEKILTTSHAPGTPTSGGSVEVLVETKLGLLTNQDFPTPPPSVSGERATPPESSEQALDLSTSHNNNNNSSSSYEDDEICYDLSKKQQQQQQMCAAAADLGDEELIAVNALLSLARYH